MKKLVGPIGIAALAVAFSTLTPAEAVAPQPDLTTSTTVAAALTSGKTWTLRDKFAREPVHYGDRDTSVYDIDHVRELQYRLLWAGTFDASVSGSFGTATRAALKQYQKREGLKRSGIATYNTWRHLIHDTIRARGAVPQVCTRKGWHACYDRSMHQVTLWHSGDLHNSWLVRGGDYDTPTRVGTNDVYYRDKDHRSGLFDGSPMPYAQFFDGGQALHGSGFMIDPFVDHSHGCINMYIEDARQLWRLTSTKRLTVTVYGAWD